MVSVTRTGQSCCIQRNRGVRTRAQPFLNIDIFGVAPPDVLGIPAFCSHRRRVRRSGECPRSWISSRELHDHAIVNGGIARWAAYCSSSGFQFSPSSIDRVSATDPRIGDDDYIRHFGRSGQIGHRPGGTLAIGYFVIQRGGAAGRIHLYPDPCKPGYGSIEVSGCGGDDEHQNQVTV